MKLTSPAIKTSAIVAASLAIIASCLLPCSAQTAPTTTGTPSRNELPPCATSSVDINVCDLPFIRSEGGCGGPCNTTPAPANETTQNDLVSSEYDDYLNTPTDTQVAGSFDDPAPQLPQNQGVFGKPANMANYGKVQTSYGGGSVKPAKMPGMSPNGGPPMIPIFTCKNGYGWMPQAGANAPMLPNGGINGGPGTIQWTGSWNPASLHQ